MNTSISGGFDIRADLDDADALRAELARLVTTGSPDFGLNADDRAVRLRDLATAAAIISRLVWLESVDIRRVDNLVAEMTSTKETAS